MTTETTSRLRGTEKSLPISQEEAWQAVLSSDPLLDGQFVYAVRTTGVFCRPTCPSRRPRRSNVRFFATPEAAERYGFRACMRCTPKGPAGNPGTKLLNKLYEYVDTHLDDHITLDKLAKHVGLSPWHVQRTFKRLTGLSPREYVAMKRMERMKASLRNGETVSRAIYDAGFNSSSVVYESSADALGMTPAAYGRGGLGVEMQFTIAESRLGLVLVAATDRGVCCVALGDDPEQLELDLHAEFPKATIERAYGGFEDWVKDITSFIDGTLDQLAVPLDVGGTQFQQRVWKELRDIPYGTTTTYAEIARRMGSPRAVRAVANACASNKAALAIPCHRVVRHDGSLGGYKWGVRRKEALLETERRKVPES